MTEKQSSLENPLTTSETVLLPDYEFTIREKLKECFKPRYRIRRVKNKGAILVLVWNYLLSSLYFYIGYTTSEIYSGWFYDIIIHTIIGVTMPIAGCLADVRFGRYKVISFSIWIMWLTSLLLTTGLVIGQLFDLKNNSYYHNIMFIALVVPLGLGYSGFQANIIQFGVDQLFDASSSEIMSFVIWFTWTIFCSVSTVSLIIMYTFDKYKLIAPLFVCINISLALCLNTLFKNVLTVEPGTKNPFKLVYKVVRYAIKNKHIRQRTAFSYCENYLPSRIDFGKSKYGGPFTTEEVEDVKTFFRVVVIVFLGCAFYGMISKQIYVPTTSITIFMSAVSSSPKFVFVCFYYFLLPVNEFLIYPLFHRCLPNLKALGKFLIGALLCFVWYTILLALITYTRVHYNTTSTLHLSSNATLPCLLHGSADFLGETLDYNWAILLDIIWVMSQELLLIGGIEFWCSQVPYSMKGLVVGIVYGFAAIFLAFSKTLSLPFKLKSIAWSTGALSCSFWYLLTMLVYMFIVLIGFAVVAKWYKRRKREDVLPNEHIFAEEYYSKYT